MAHVDIDALKERYAAERLKRLRPDGNDQYIRVAGQLSHYLDDPYTPVADRPPRFDHVTVAVVGGGFAGLLTAARVKEIGIRDVRLVDKAGDVGGTWYWNRYPGAQCDTASFVYMPLLEETSHMPSEKYAHGPEILEHCRHIAATYDLYDDALFHTEVTALRWDGSRARWTVTTNRGDAFTAQYVVLGTGPLHVPKLPGVPGIESFEGHSFHTSRWDYDYTGGSPLGEPMDRLSDRRVAVIGTGATSVQCVPHLARACRELYVFQRTPSSVDARNNAPTDSEWFKQVATALDGELRGDPVRTHARRGPRPGRLDRPRPSDPRADHGDPARRGDTGADDGRVRGVGLRENGGDSRSGRRTRRGPRDRCRPQGLVQAAVQAAVLSR